MTTAATPATAAAFDYQTMTMRNIGLVSTAEQARLRSARVFICGIGGMGGACLQAMVRAGVTHFSLADIDVFEVSNLNRQVFSSLTVVGQSKMAATIEQLRQINPEVEIACFDRNWTGHLPEILRTHKIVVNGMDDIAAGIHLYREAAAAGAVVIDAYTSPLPSVYVVRAQDPRPEERLAYPSRGTPWDELSKDQLDGCRAAEITYVLTHSSSVQQVDLKLAAEMLTGKRSRMSFAPMVIATGNMMAIEAINACLGRPRGTDHRGYFFNPWKSRVEKPLAAPVAKVKKKLVQIFLWGLTRGL